MEEVTNCPICSKTDLIPYLKTKDYFGNKEEFSILRCTNCDTLSTSPLPNRNEIIKYYKSNSYISHGDKKATLKDYAYQLVQRRNFQYKRNVIQRYVTNFNHLDYGCGDGSFINYLKKNSWQVSGYEPDDEARNRALSKGLNVVQLIDKLSDNKPYNSISLFHVLEHVHEIEETINSLLSILDRNGVLILALPNYKSHDAQFYREYWAGYDVPRHLHHFSQKSVHQLADCFNLNLLATHPLHYDSYYVSLLSEQYKTGNSSYINAIKNGYVSNRKAKSTKEYSSLIYIFTK